MSINIPRQTLPPIVEQQIDYQLVGDKIKRYFVKRYDGKFAEVTKNDYTKYRNNPYFEKVILTWYIRGTEDFVRTNNQRQIDLGEQQIKGIRKLVVNPLQLYQGER